MSVPVDVNEKNPLNVCLLAVMLRKVFPCCFVSGWSCVDIKNLDFTKTLFFHLSNIAASMSLNVGGVPQTSMWLPGWWCWEVLWTFQKWDPVGVLRLLGACLSREL